MLNFLEKIDHTVEKVSSWVLITSVFSMLLLSLMVIVFRWASITMMWAEPLVRHLVFLSAFLGGVLATGRGNHIGIDVISRYLDSAHHDNLKLQLSRIISFFSFFHYSLVNESIL